jgi:sugar/nucleoside kinase (ribokinase family)
MFDVITVGAGTRDVFLLSKQFKFIESAQFETGIGECVSLGAKIELDEIVHTTGGGATNAAVTFARLGFRTAAICRVGDDSAGRDLIIDLQREGVGTTLVVRVPGGTTGYSTLLTAVTGERTVLVYRGVSAEFADKDIPWSECNTRWTYLTSLGGNLELAKKMVSCATHSGIQVAWNPGSLEIAKGMKKIAPLLKGVRVFNINREEAEKLSGEKSLPNIFKRLATIGNIVLVTDGANGAYAHQNGATFFAATTGVKARSQTGAGDAFGSGFVASFMKTNNIKTALATATLNAESVIKQVGAKAGLLKKFPTATQIAKIKIKSV